MLQSISARLCPPSFEGPFSCPVSISKAAKAAIGLFALIGLYAYFRPAQPLSELIPSFEPEKLICPPLPNRESPLNWADYASYSCVKDTFLFTDRVPQKPSPLFELQKTVSLPEGTSLIKVDMEDPPKVVHASEAPLFLYTDGLGPCIAVIGKSKTSEKSMLIGVAHYYSDRDFHLDEKAYPPGTEVEDLFLIPKTVIRNNHFSPQKMIDLIAEFLGHPDYSGEKIELFFAGGCGDSYCVFIRELLLEFSKKIPVVEVVGSFFNPYQATPTIEEEIKDTAVPHSLLAGITNQGSILLQKFCDFSFSPSCDPA